MKSICVFLITLFITGKVINAQPFNELSFKKIDGTVVTTAQFTGKKIMFIVIPINQQDSVFQQLNVFKGRYKDSVRIIGIPSFEDGFTVSMTASISAMYSAMGITLAEGMYTRKSSAGQQSPLMQWFTNKDKNQRFNDDVTGVGHKFFVNESGRLYAVISPRASLQFPIIDRVIHSNSQ
jgi:glutathione peroxidase-family protein